MTLEEARDVLGLIEGNFYSVLKEWGLPTERYPNGDYKDEKSQIAWDAYRCGKMNTHCEAVHPEDWPPEASAPDNFSTGD